MLEFACDVGQDCTRGNQVSVSWKHCQVVPHEGVDLGASEVGASGLNVGPCECGTPGGDRGDLAYEQLEVRGELTEAELLVPELEHLNAVGLERVHCARALAESEHLAGSLLPLVPAALEQRPHGAQRCCVHEQLGLTEVVGEHGEAVDVVVGLSRRQWSRRATERQMRARASI